MKPTISDDGDPPEDDDLELAAEKSPNSNLAVGPLFSATLVLPVRMTERPSVRPASANSVAERDDEGRHRGADHQDAVDEADDQPKAKRREPCRR